MKLARQLNRQYGDGVDKYIIPSYEELHGTTYTKAGFYNHSSIADHYWLRTPMDNSNARVVRSAYNTVYERYRGIGYNSGIRPMFYLDTTAFNSMNWKGFGAEADPYVLEDRYDVKQRLYLKESVLFSRVMLTVSTDSGYKVKSVDVDNGAEVTDNKDGTYSFQMPWKPVAHSCLLYTNNWSYGGRRIPQSLLLRRR